MFFFFKICFSIAYNNCQINHWTTLRGVVCLKFNVRNGRDVANAFIQTFKRGAFSNRIDTDKTPHNAASHQGLCFMPC